MATGMIENEAARFGANWLSPALNLAFGVKFLPTDSTAMALRSLGLAGDQI